MGGRLPAKYKWYGEWMTAKEIAELENIPLNTTRMYFSCCQGNADCVRKLISRRGKSRSTSIKYPYRDGRMLSVPEIMEREPHMTSWKVRNRYQQCEPGDWDKIFSKGRVQILPNTGKSKLDSKAIGEGLGPRKNIMDIKGPSNYEYALWEG